MIKKLLISLSLLIGINCNAADTYDATTSILTIPQVKVSDTLYKNVVLTLDSVISVGSSCTISTTYSAAAAYEAVCTSSDGLHAASSKLSPATDVLPATSAVSDSVIPNFGPAYSSGVLGSTANSAHETAYPSYTSYCNYINQSATSLQTPATLTYYNTSGTLSSGTSQSTISSIYSKMCFWYAGFLGQ
jgi:hypothetical protein